MEKKDNIPERLFGAVVHQSVSIENMHVYIATGNVYSVPENASQCQENQNNNSTQPLIQTLVLNLINMSTQSLPLIWTLAISSGTASWVAMMYMVCEMFP